MASLTYLGHATFRIKTNEGKVIYIDPFGGQPYYYNQPADLILITHEHYDHNELKLVPLKTGAKVIRSINALNNGIYKEFDIGGILVKATPAYNSHHVKDECVGYLISFDGLKLYHAGDTDFIPEMRDLNKENIDYALLPCDGTYTMNTEDFDKAIEAISPRFAIPMHTHVGVDFDDEVVSHIYTPKKLVLHPGEKVAL